MDFHTKKIIAPRGFKEHPSFVGGFTTPLLGNQSFFRPLVSEEVTRQNRMDLAEALGISANNLVSPHLIHSNNVIQVDHSHRGKGALDRSSALADGDGLMTREKNVFLLTTAADCVPILLWDPVTLTCASLHGGRRGLLAGIVPEALKLASQLGCQVENLQVAIGPSIRKCCYSVDNKTARDFGTALGDEFLSEKKGDFYLDLIGVIRHQLTQGGILSDHLDIHPHCTCCNPFMYYSARRDGQEYFQTLAAVIGVLP